jgi:hypothetical protein
MSQYITVESFFGHRVDITNTQNKYKKEGGRDLVNGKLRRMHLKVFLAAMTRNWVASKLCCYNANCKRLVIRY